VDPSATVRAEGDIKVQLSAASISAPQVTSQRPESRNMELTNFSVFKRVPFDKGSVVTGWIFLTSSQKYPTKEYCYYTEDAETPGVKIDLILGENQKPEIPKTAPRNFNTAAAFYRCVWFRG
jgi:hypothetical protein